MVLYILFARACDPVVALLKESGQYRSSAEGNSACQKMSVNDRLMVSSRTVTGLAKADNSTAAETRWIEGVRSGCVIGVTATAVTPRTATPATRCERSEICMTLIPFAVSHD